MGVAAFVVSLIAVVISALNFIYTRYEFRRSQAQSLDLFERSGPLVDAYLVWGSFHALDPNCATVHSHDVKRHYTVSIRPEAVVRESMRKAPLVGVLLQNRGRGAISIREVQLARKVRRETARMGLRWQVDTESVRFLTGQSFPVRLEGKQSDIFLMSLLDMHPPQFDICIISFIALLEDGRSVQTQESFYGIELYQRIKSLLQEHGYET